MVPFAKGDRIFVEDAVLDSSYDVRVLVAAFREEVLSSRPLVAREPIWGLVANFVTLVARAKSGQPRGFSAGDRTCLAALGSFYRPPSGERAPQSEPYEAFAQEVHRSLTDRAQAAVSPSCLSDLLNVIRLNAHTVRIYSETGRPLVDEGLGLFPWLHLMSHSCAPNSRFTSAVPGACPEAAAHPIGGTLARRPARVELRATRSVAVGEELSISYLDDFTLSLPCGARRRGLRRDFGFDCRCPRCAREAAGGGATAARAQQL